jgi:hypothetical protein
MRVMLSGSHLHRPEPATVEIRFVLKHGGCEVRLGHLPIAFIESVEGGRYRIRTMPGSTQLPVEFVSLHAAFCAMENLIQTGGSGEWIAWSKEARVRHVEASILTTVVDRRANAGSAVNCTEPTLACFTEREPWMT